MAGSPLGMGLSRVGAAPTSYLVESPCRRDAPFRGGANDVGRGAETPGPDQSARRWTLLRTRGRRVRRPRDPIRRSSLVFPRGFRTGINCRSGKGSGRLLPPSPRGGRGNDFAGAGGRALPLRVFTCRHSVGPTPLWCAVGASPG